MQTTLVALSAALILVSAATQASELCDAERSIATTISQARERQVPEEKVAEQLRSTFPDEHQQQGVLALAHVIYTSPDLKDMTPDQIGSAIGSNCESQPQPVK